jgi:hypothetical protein
MKRGTVAVACLIAGVVGFSIAVSAWGAGPGSDARDRAEKQANIFVGGNPLGEGPEVTEQALRSAFEGCGVCDLPADGAASWATIQHAWTRSDGKVAIDFVDGLRIYFTLDTRTNDEYIAEVESVLQESDSYSMVALRNVKALAREMTGSSPSALLWIEDGYLVEIIGHGKQELPELIAAGSKLGSGN